MAVHTGNIECKTEGNGDTVDLTADAARVVEESGFESGVLTLFVSGSTAALTTIEFEPGAVSDFARLLEEVAPRDREYRHHLRWGDDNGHSHVRAALISPSLTVPFVEGRLTLGTWQQIVFLDFDTRPRSRQLIVQMIGE